MIYEQRDLKELEQNNYHVKLSVFLIKLIYLWRTSWAATGRPNYAFLNEIQARWHWWQA